MPITERISRQAARQQSAAISQARREKLGGVLSAIRSRRAQDPLTKAATFLEQQAGVPLMFRVRQHKGRGRKPVIKDITPMRGISPLDVVSYEKKRLATGDYLLYPILSEGLKKHPGRAPGLTYDELVLTETEIPKAAPGLSGYEAVSGYYNVSELAGYEYEGLGGLLDFVKTAVSKVKQVVLHPIQTIKTATAKRSVMNYAANLSPEQKTQLLAATGAQTGGKGIDILSTTTPSNILQVIQQAQNAGKIPPDVAAAAQQEMAQGDPGAAYEYMQTAAPETFGERPSTPAWVLPAAIVGGALILTRMKK